MSGGKGGGGGCGDASCDFYNGYASAVKTGSRYELGVSPTFIEAAVRQGRRRRDVNVETNLKSLRNGGTVLFRTSHWRRVTKARSQPPGKFFPTTSHNLPTSRSLAYHVHAAGGGKRSLSDRLRQSALLLRVYDMDATAAHSVLLCQELYHLICERCDNTTLSALSHTSLPDLQETALD